MSEVKIFQREYGFSIGGGPISEELRIKSKRCNRDLIVEMQAYDEVRSSNF